MLNIKIIAVKSKSDNRGKLSVIQESSIPFQIKRVFWIQGIGETVRGKHAHYKTRQCIVCIKGSCKVSLDDGKHKEEIILDDGSKGLIVEPNFWTAIYDASPDCILLVLASEEYDEKDYIGDYKKFKETYSG